MKHDENMKQYERFEKKGLILWSLVYFKLGVIQLNPCFDVIEKAE